MILGSSPQGDQSIEGQRQPADRGQSTNPDTFYYSFGLLQGRT